MKKWGLFSLLLMVSTLAFANPPPPAKDVFSLTTKEVDPNTFMLNWQIKNGFFLYKKRIKLVNPESSNVHLGEARYPKPLNHTDARGQTYEVYRGDLTLPVSVLGESAGESVIQVEFQGCSDEGFCYPPQTNQIKLTINNHLALTGVSIETDTDTLIEKSPVVSENDKLDQLLSTSNWAIIALSFFGFGLLLSLTPCILPMVPVLSGIIVGHGHTISTRKAFFLSLSYVLSMSITYALVGAVVALMGSNLQVAMQSPWFISLFSLIFILLALSMFNVYELRLPVSWQAKLAGVTRSQSGGHYLSAAVMGCLSTLILSPCVTAPLIGVLGYVAHTGNITLGSLALFFLSLGMGTPLLLIGASAGRLLPHAGQWMNAVKSFFGVILLGVAIYLMQRILPAMLTMGLWACLLIFTGIYAGALTKSDSHQEKFCQGIGIVLLVYGLLILIGASLGHSNPLLPLVSQETARVENKTMVVSTLEEVQQVMANNQGKPVILDFYADWCASCKVIEATTLKNKQVLNELGKFIVLKVDLTANNAKSKALLNYFKVVAPPTFLFFDTKGNELNQLRLVGEVSTSQFITYLGQASQP